MNTIGRRLTISIVTIALLFFPHVSAAEDLGARCAATSPIGDPPPICPTAPANSADGYASQTSVTPDPTALANNLGGLLPGSICGVGCTVSPFLALTAGPLLPGSNPVDGGGLDRGGWDLLGPVQPRLGAFRYYQKLLEVPSVGRPFRFEIFYSSRTMSAADPTKPFDGPLGLGWNYSYSWPLSQWPPCTDVRIITPNLGVLNSMHSSATTTPHRWPTTTSSRRTPKGFCWRTSTAA